MRAKHLGSTSRALYDVFVFPSLSQASPALPPSVYAAPKTTTTSQPREHATTSHRSFTTSLHRHVKTRAPEVRTEKWDEEIQSAQIYIVDASTGRISERPMTRYDVLARMDRMTHRLIQVGEAPGPSDAFSANTIPVCKIMSKKDSYLNDQRKKAESKEKRRLSNITSSVKTLELNWAIDANDLAHRLERMRTFLEEGRKVEVVLAAKKRGRKASDVECEDVLRKIRGVVDEINGAREDGSTQGSLGGLITLAFVGRPVKVGKEKDVG